MGDLVVGLAKSVVEGALTQVQSAIEEEAKLRHSAQRNLVFITGEFEMMHSFLSVADEERVKNSVVKTWVRQVRELAYDVEDCIEFVVHLDNKPHWWRRLLPSCVAAAALPLDEAVAEIEQLKARVKDVSKRNTRYSLISDSGSKSVMHQLQLAPSGAVGATTLNMLIEARDSAKRLQGLRDLTQLITENDDDLQVTSVWGTGGDLGTTSIIRKAYGDPKICRNFECRGWVKLTHPFNPHEFLRSLVAQFYTNSCLGQGTTVDVDELKRMEATATTQGGLVEEFMKQVNEKRYLVVLENVYTMGEWDAVRTYLPDKKNGSWVIVSTQQWEIASLCIGHSYQVLELKQYSAEHSVCVFFKEGSEGDGDKADETDQATANNNDISTYCSPSKNNDISTEDEGSRRDGLSSYDRVLSAKRNEARDCMRHFTLVGRESQMNELRKYTAKAHLNSLQVMSVWGGIPGVGKSTLVRNLCYDRMLHSDQFDKYGWVDVFPPFNLRDFSRSLLVNFHSESLQAMEGTAYRGALGIKDPVQECRKLLKEHRCLVVIDNLQSMEEWDMIQLALVSRPSKSLIIVITTEASIAAYCADNKDVVFNVKGLEADAAFDLFKKEVQRNNRSSPLKDSEATSKKKDSEDVEIRELILKCGGLPIVIVAIADFLAPKTFRWMDTASSMNPRFMHELETNPEFAILRDLFFWIHSYFRTCPDFLKPCIFYLSIFPRDHSIRRRRLVRRWIAEGYSTDTDNNSAEQNGEMFFSKFLDLNIIQQSPQLVTTASNDIRTILCQVNSFIREYVFSRRMEENLVFELGGSCTLTTQRTGRHLVIQKSWDRDRIVFKSIDFSRLRSLTVFGEWRQFFISDRMRLLRVLDLEDASGVTDDDLEQMVKLLSRLKFLSLRGCSEICRLPTSLGDLRQLQTLDVRHTSIATLPVNITKLQKLQYVRAGTTVPAEEPSTQRILVPCRRHQLVGVVVPIGVGTLTSLHTLGVVNVGAAWRKPILKELKKLTQLRKLGVSGINRKNSKEFFSVVSGHGHLESLSIRLDKDNQGCLELDVNSQPLGNLNLQSLKLYGLVDKLPVWIKILTKLTKLDLEMTLLAQDDIKVLGNLPKLCFLRLCVNPLQDGKLHICVMTSGLEERSYQKVNVLEIACSSGLHVSFGSQTMQTLELLKVRCYSGSSLQFSGLERLTELKEVLLKGSYDEALVQNLQGLLAKHRKEPALKLEKQRSS